MRWYESYLIGPDVGHIPVSNLYEVFVMFCWMTAAFYLYYEEQYETRSLGAFVMLVVSAAVGFLLWYTVVREAHEIQPLVPALKSWWMKLHVPANFIGYGTFALAAMVAFAYLIKMQASETRWYKLAPLWLLGVVLCFEPIVFRQNATEGGSSYWMVYFGISALIVAAILWGRKRIAERLPSFEVLDDVMYKSIAVGFAFFTIATVLGALWAAEAWGGYWSWDPKETWALIVWLNYAAWLHMRLMKGLRHCRVVASPILPREPVGSHRGDFAVEPLGLVEEPTDLVHHLLAHSVVFHAGFANTSQIMRLRLVDQPGVDEGLEGFALVGSEVGVLQVALAAGEVPHGLLQRIGGAPKAVAGAQDRDA